MFNQIKYLQIKLFDTEVIGIIIVILICVLCVSIGLSIYITLPKLREKYFKIVEETSERYKALINISDKYKSKFDFTVKQEYPFYIPLDSKPKFDKFDFENYIMEVVEDRMLDWEELYKKAKYNKMLYDEYRKEFTRIPCETTKKQAKEYGVPYNFYHEYEQMICRSERLNPTTSFQITVCISYTSPQGRNSYNNSRTYRDDDIVYNYIEKVKERIEFRKTKQYQRSLVTESKRYDIMKRDGFKCILCGRSAADGVKLHVDHIKPIAKYGESDDNNLRTLCEECNRGKRDKYDEYGIN